MKNLLVTALFTAMASVSFAQDSEESTTTEKDNYEIKTLFGGGKTSNGGFGALMANYNEIGSHEALLVGARGGWIMNHGFSLGLGGYGLTNNIYYTNSVNDEKYQLEMGYGGFYAEVTIGSKWPVHVSFPVLVGAGGAAYTSSNSDSSDPWDDESTVTDSDAFFVVEPGAILELNITKFFRLGFNVNYRWTKGLDLNQTSDSDLEGYSGGVTFKFGKF